MNNIDESATVVVLMRLENKVVVEDIPRSDVIYQIKVKRYGGEYLTFENFAKD